MKILPPFDQRQITVLPVFIAVVVAFIIYLYIALYCLSLFDLWVSPNAFTLL